MNIRPKFEFIKLISPFPKSNLIKKHNSVHFLHRFLTWMIMFIISSLRTVNYYQAAMIVFSYKVLPTISGF